MNFENRKRNQTPSLGGRGSEDLNWSLSLCILCSRRHTHTHTPAEGQRDKEKQRERQRKVETGKLRQIMIKNVVHF